MTISKNCRTMYDFLAREYPDIFEWCKDQARWHRCPIGAILTWKEDAIMRLIEKKKIEKVQNICPNCGARMEEE